MPLKNRLWWIYGTGVGFILVNALLIANEIFWFPILSLIALVIYLAFYHLDILFFLAIIATPLSVTLENKDFNVAMSFPAELLMIAASTGFIIKMVYDGAISRKILFHPVTLSVLVYLFWILVTSITSEMPLISFKFFAARCWFIITCFFLGIFVFKKTSNMRLFTWLYMIPFSGVIIYTFIRHYAHNFDEEHAHWMMWPFYYDHTIYGAVIAFFLPLLCGYLFSYRFYKEPLAKIFILVMLLLFSAAMVLSYTRAGWISVACALIVFLILLFRIRFAFVFLTAILIGGYFYAFRGEIQQKMEKNRQISSDELIEHVHSIYNITTDVSNTERLNRWKSAIRMFLERPVTGWGPGTYMFLYAPFQASEDMTWISTNAGNLGNAHSEYIGPLAESGFPGSLTFIFIVIACIYTAVRFLKRVHDKTARLTMMLIFCGLTTYFVHGILNNFLDTDKASVPFWGFLAIVVAMDVFHGKDNHALHNPPSPH